MDVIEFPIDITKLKFKKTKKCCKCLIIKDISEYYYAGGPCKSCRSINNKINYNYVKETKPRMYHKNINGQRILLTVINGKKTCINCLIIKAVTEFYDDLGSCKACVSLKRKEQYNLKKQ